MRFSSKLFSKVALAVLAVFALASVGTGVAAAGKASKGPFVIGYDIYFAGNSWSTQLTDEFQAAAARHHSEIKHVYFTSSNGDVNKQISNLQDMIAEHVNAIIVTPNSPTALIPVIKEAEAHGIKVILNAATISSPDYTALVNVNDYAYGLAAARWLATTIHGKGNVVMLDGIPGISTNDDRVKAAKAVFAKYPNIHVIAEEPTNWQLDQSKIAMSNILAAHSQPIAGILSSGGMVAMGVVDAYHAAKRSPIPPVVGDDMNGFLKYWKKYHLTAVGVVKPTYLSAVALQVALDALEGKPFKKNDIFPPTIITAKTLNRYLKPNMPDSFWTATRMTPAQIKKFWTNSSQN